MKFILKNYILGFYLVCLDKGCYQLRVESNSNPFLISLFFIVHAYYNTLFLKWKHLLKYRIKYWFIFIYLFKLSNYLFICNIHNSVWFWINNDFSNIWLNIILFIRIYYHINKIFIFILAACSFQWNIYNIQFIL